MKLWNKVGAGLVRVRQTPGIRGKISTFRQLSQVALRSRLGNQANGATDSWVAAEAWADYHLLSYVCRDIKVDLDANLPPEFGLCCQSLTPRSFLGATPRYSSS